MILMLNGVENPDINVVGKLFKMSPLRETNYTHGLIESSSMFTYADWYASFLSTKILSSK